MATRRKNPKHKFLKRPCIRCGNLFDPSSKFNLTCPPCREKSSDRRKK